MVAISEKINTIDVIKIALKIFFKISLKTCMIILAIEYIDKGLICNIMNASSILFKKYIIAGISPVSIATIFYNR